MNKQTEAEYEAFNEGFSLVCEDSLIKIFRPEELELLICGETNLNFYDLESVTSYEGYMKDFRVIKWFWEIVHSMNSDLKKKLLFFVTGSNRSPIGGLKKLVFVISRNGPDSERLPTAHTCFNILLLPEYGKKETLKKLLTTALQNAEGFGLI